MSLAFSSKSPNVPDPKTNAMASRWIASLSDGSTVFEDITPGEISAWRRLSKYIQQNKLKVTNLRLEAYGRRVHLIPYKDASGNAQLNGYWHSRRIHGLMCSSGVIQAKSIGVGILKGKELWITWVFEDGTCKQEIRDYEGGDLAVIVNNAP